MQLIGNICVQKMHDIGTAMPCIAIACATLFMMLLQCVKLIIICEQYEALQFT